MNKETKPTLRFAQVSTDIPNAGGMQDSLMPMRINMAGVVRGQAVLTPIDAAGSDNNSVFEYSDVTMLNAVVPPLPIPIPIPIPMVANDRQNGVSSHSWKDRETNIAIIDHQAAWRPSSALANSSVAAQLPGFLQTLDPRSCDFSTSDMFDDETEVVPTVADNGHEFATIADERGKIWSTGIAESGLVDPAADIQASSLYRAASQNQAKGTKKTVIKANGRNFGYDEVRLTRDDYRYLGSSGIRTSIFGLGTWVTFGAQVTDEVADEILTFAYDNGINYFDTAPSYAGGRAEILLGKLLKSKRWRRSTYMISTKVQCLGKAETERSMSRKFIIESVKESRMRLQLEYVDIVFACAFDQRIPVEEIVRAFTFLINQGHVMYWGTSGWSITDIQSAYSIARQLQLIPPLVEQAEYNLFERNKVEQQLPQLMSKIGTGIVSWSPLASGFLSGKYDDGIPIYSRAAFRGLGWLKDKILSEDGRRQQAKLRKLSNVASNLNCSLAQLALAWCAKNTNVSSVLIGVTSVEQLTENLQSLKISKNLTAEVSKNIEEIISGL